MKDSKLLINSSLLSVLSVYACYLLLFTPLNGIVRSVAGSGNIPCYALSIALFLILVIGLSRIKIHIPAFILLIGNIMAALFLVFSWLNEKNNFAAFDGPPIELISEPIRYLLYFLALCLFLFVTWRIAKGKVLFGKRGKTVFVVLTIAIAGLAAYNQYVPNVFTATHITAHFNAYTNSIWNVFWGQPFTPTITSIYGHYAFLYCPFLKLGRLLGIESLIELYMILSGAIAAATVLMWAFVLAALVKRTELRLLGVVGIGYINCARITRVYHQLAPHRLFPQAIIALMMVLWMRSRKKTWITLCGYIVCILLVVWNTEYGIFAAVAFSALQCCHAIQRKGFKPWLTVVINILAIPAVFIAAVLFCGLLNVTMGGSMISVSDFVFPMLDKGYMQGYLEYPLANYPAAWMSITACLLCFLGAGLSDTVLCSGKCRQNDRTALYFGLAVLGLGCITYAINRPSYGNFYVMMPLMAVLIAVTAETGTQSLAELFQSKYDKDSVRIHRGCLCLISLAVMSVITASFLLNAPYKIQQQIPYKDKESIQGFLEDLKARGNGDEYAFGMAAQTGFAMLGWDPKYYAMDLADFTINPAAREEIGEKLNALYGKGLFYSYDTDWLGHIPENYSAEAYVPVDIFSFNNQVIEYCKPVKLIRRHDHAKMAK